MTPIEHGQGFAARARAILESFGVPGALYTGGALKVTTPISREVIGRVHLAGPGEVNAAVEAARAAFLEWREVPAPARGELVRLFGEELRANKAALGELVTLEAGKIAVRGPGRGPGDDRHLRLRRRPVPPAPRPDHRLASGRSIA